MKRSVEIKNQIKFCSDLMNRLEKELTEDLGNSCVDVDKCFGTYRYTQRKADVIRLRRELLNLSNLIATDYNR